MIVLMHKIAGSKVKTTATLLFLLLLQIVCYTFVVCHSRSFPLPISLLLWFLPFPFALVGFRRDREKEFEGGGASNGRRQDQGGARLL